MPIQIFSHHIYEYKKGLRNMILFTANSSQVDFIKKKLDNNKIAYVIRYISDSKINVFFGNEDSINIIKQFDKPLNEYSANEDFILGTLLGYDIGLQCKRYLKYQKRKYAQEIS